MIYQSATELTQRIQAGDLSPVEAVDLYIDRAEFVNASLNAIVSYRFERAREEARAAMDVKKSARGRLYGVPMTIKEMISVEGMPVTAGSASRRHAIAERDATVVRRLRDEGAIIIGVTNQSELGLWWESNNAVYGRTKNPHDPKRTPGGSSGGEGAIVAALGSAVGLGSDMGGSVRLPAMFCGIYGHKPSGGTVPVTGHFPVDLSNARLEDPPNTKLIAIGPLARHPDDLKLVYDIIRGPCDEDENSRRALTRARRVRRAFILPDPNIRLASSASKAQREAVEIAGDVLRSAGVKVESFDENFFKRAFEIYAGVLGSFDGALETVIAGETGMALAREATRFLRSKSEHTAPAWVAVLGERLLSPSNRAIKKALARNREMIDALNELLADDGVLILPTFPRTAPRHFSTLLKPFDISYTAIFNSLELPVTAAPIGMASDGLPTGVQIVGAMDHDNLTLEVASILHDATGGAIPPVFD